MGSVEPSVTESGQKENITGKFLKTLPGVETGASGLMVQCLNQLHNPLNIIINLNPLK
jgi:hypothetical protein